MIGEGGEQRLLRRFTRDFGLYSVAAVVPSLFGVTALIIFTRVFRPAAYGRYALVMAFAIICSTIMFGWLQQSVLRFETETETAVLTANIVFLLSIIGGVGVIAGGTGYIVLGPHLGSYRPFYAGALVLIIARGAFQVFKAFFRARLESTRLTAFKVLKAALTFVFALILAIWVFESIVGWIWGAALATSITILSMLYRAESLRVLPSFDRGLCTRIFMYGGPMVVWLLGLTFLTFADRMLLEYFRGSAAVGVYSSNYTIIGSGLPLVLTPIIQTVHPLVMDLWDGENHDEIRAVVTKFTRYYLIIAVPATAFAIVVSRPLSTLFLGADYRPGYVIIPIVALALFFWNIAMIGHKGLEVQERTSVLAVGVVLATLTNIGLNIVLIRMYGYVGAAVATLLSFALYTVFAYLISRWYIPWRLPWQTIRNTIGATGLTMLPGIALAARGNASTVSLIAAGTVGALAYLIVLYFLDEFERQELALIEQYV